MIKAQKHNSFNTYAFCSGKLSPDNVLTQKFIRTLGFANEYLSNKVYIFGGFSTSRPIRDDDLSPSRVLLFSSRMYNSLKHSLFNISYV
jgi:hypothetical protein